MDNIEEKIEVKPKRKTKTSKEVKKRYEDKTYKRFVVRLRHDTDQELIDYIEAEQSKGVGTSEIFRKIGSGFLNNLDK